MTSYKKKVFVVCDVKHLGNSVVHHPDPFAIGMCVVLWSDTQQKFTVQHDYDARILIAVATDNTRKASPEVLDWWTTNFPEMFLKLTEPRECMDASRACTVIARYVGNVRQKLVVDKDRELCVCTDAPDDLHLLDCMLERYGHKWLRFLANPETTHNDYLNIQKWLEGRDQALRTTIAEYRRQAELATKDSALALAAALEASAERRLSKNILTEHEHNHDPLHDAWHLGEMLCGALNADEAAASASVAA